MCFRKGRVAIWYHVKYQSWGLLSWGEFSVNLKCPSNLTIGLIKSYENYFIITFLFIITYLFIIIFFPEKSKKFLSLIFHLRIGCLKYPLNIMEIIWWTCRLLQAMSFLLDAMLKDFHYCLEIQYVQDNNVNIKEKNKKLLRKMWVI